MDSSNNPKHVCCYCEKNFTRKDNMNKHIRVVHKQEPAMSKHVLKCPAFNCNQICHSMKVLRHHISNQHNVFLETEEFTFSTFEEFKLWKEHMEKEEFCSYIQHRSFATKLSGEKIAHYMCHRSGYFHSRSNNKRFIKGLGSKKISGYCPATLDVQVKKDGLVKVKYNKTHFGHGVRIGHMFLTKNDRKIIADKIKEGVNLQKILDDIRDSSDGRFNRLHLLTRKDLHNIQREFKISHVEKKHENDAISVKLWVESLSQSENSPIVYFKEQGRNDDNEILENKDFEIVIMSKFQQLMFQQFAKEKICIDSTHGTNSYDFQLTTLLTVDEFGSGLPVAFCISNRIDSVAMKVFFDAVKNKTGEVSTNVFMSDDAPAYFNAWQQCMGPAGHQLLSSWHVDNSWRKNLNKIKGPITKKVMVYKALRVLMQETNAEKFKIMHENVLNYLLNNDDTKAFGIYFRDTYSKRPDQWAYYARIHLGINTNMYLESMHKILKHFYLEGKKGKRVDKILVTLLKFNRDKLFERMIKLSKNVSSNRTKAIRSSHLRSMHFSSSQIQVKDENIWEVDSDLPVEQKYVVEKAVDPLCINKCNLKCFQCNICIHMFKCTCLNNRIQFNICKHIHACCRLFQKLDEAPEIEKNEVNEMKELIDNCDEITVASSVTGIDLMQQKINVLQSHLRENSYSIECQKMMNHHLDKLLSISSKGQNVEYMPKESTINEPFNKKIQPQMRFKSTKKKNEAKTGMMSKPSQNESSFITSALMNPDEETLYIHKVLDHIY